MFIVWFLFKNSIFGQFKQEILAENLIFRRFLDPRKWKFDPETKN